MYRVCTTAVAEKVEYGSTFLADASHPYIFCPIDDFCDSGNLCKREIILIGFIQRQTICQTHFSYKLTGPREVIKLLLCIQTIRVVGAALFAVIIRVRVCVHVHQNQSI